MNSFKGLLLAIIICFAGFSCKKDTPTPEQKPSDYAFAKETVDEGKTNLESTGQQLVDEMQAMNKVEAAPVLESLSSLFSQPDEAVVTFKASPFMRTILAAANLSNGKANLNAVTKSMKLDIDEDTTFLQVYNSMKGVYTWNNISADWVKTAGNDITFLFPSTKGGTVNNATLKITYTGIAGLQLVDGYSGDLPSTINATITVGSKKVFEINFNAAYNNDGVPSAVNYFIALYPFKYEISWTYSASTIELRYQLTNGAKNIMDCYGSVGGNFSKENIDKVDADKESEPTDVFSNGNAYFQLFDVKLAGSIDFLNLYNAQKNIDIDDEFKADTALVKELNKYVAIDLVYVSKQQKIAQVEFYPIKKVETYYGWNSKGEFGLITKTSSDIDIHFIFADGSKGDMESYFSKGFEDLVNDLNAFIVELNNDYKLSIKSID